MKKLLLIALIIFSASQAVLAQTLVGTSPTNKNAILEEFTGVKCGYCPDGHARAQAILDAYPERAFVVAYHPSNGSFNTPYDGDEDLRRTWPSVFWGTFSGSTAMPGAFVNRRQWNGGIRWQNRGLWASQCQTIMNEPSPVNVGYSSSYKNGTLTVNVELYYTQDVTSTNTINVTLSQNGIVTQQASGGAEYSHKHTFREGLTKADWGDPVTEATTQGSLVKRTYTFQNSKNYPMDKCEVIVFVRNGANEEIITGTGGPAITPDAKMSIDGETSFVLMPMDNVEKEFTITSTAGADVNYLMTIEKSARTPADWTLTADAPLTSTFKLAKSETKKVNVKLTVGPTNVCGDAVVKLKNMSNTSAADIVKSFTVISSAIKGVQVLDDLSKDANGNYVYGLFNLDAGLALAKTSYKFGYVTPAQFDLILNTSAKPKVVIWNLGEATIASSTTLTKISGLSHEDINVMFVGLPSILSMSANNPGMLAYLGISYPGAIFNQYTGANKEYFDLKGYSGDPISAGFAEACTRITYLTEGIAIADKNIASPILRHKNADSLVATKHQLANSRFILFSFNPFSINKASSRNNLIAKCAEWLDAGTFEGPKLTTLTTSMDFGEIESGAVQSLPIDIENKGNADLEISAIALTGDAAFTIESGGINGGNIVVVPEESHGISIKFAPTEEGKEYNGTLTITSNDPAVPSLVIPIIGKSESNEPVPEFEFSLQALTFGEVNSGQSMELPVTITNTGEADLIINEMELTGDGKFMFKITGGNTGLPKTITPGGEHEVTIKFTPQTDLEEDTDYEAIFTVKTNIDKPEGYSLAVSGTGKAVNGVNDDGSITNGIMTLKAGPNPFTTESVISLTLNEASANVELYVIDATGRIMARLINGVLTQGIYTRSLSAAGLASGTYYIQAKANGRTIQLPVVLIK